MNPRFRARSLSRRLSSSLSDLQSERSTYREKKERTMNRLIQLKTLVMPLLIAFVFGCFVSPPTSLAKGPRVSTNTAFGTGALFSVTTGDGNTAVGFNCMYYDTTGFANTAVGWNALELGTSSSNSTAIGVQALVHNNADGNTAIGANALQENTSGTSNAATGNIALFNNTSGNNNTADGSGALSSNTEGDANTGLGYNALVNNTTGSNNIAVGFVAGLNLTTGDYNIDIGNQGVPDEAGTIRIGDSNQTATYIAGISGQTASGGAAVYVSSDGKLGTSTSSKRFKEDIQPMDKASEAILALRPVSFRYKKEIDPKAIPQFGLVAEEVEKVNPDLVVRDKEGKPYTVRYEAVNAMLLNEFLKEHRKVEQLKNDFQTTVVQQQKEIQTLWAQLKGQAAQIQRVSAQLEVSKPTPQTAANN
jgi:Chaperone of endosialidase